MPLSECSDLRENCFLQQVSNKSLAPREVTTSWSDNCQLKEGEKTQHSFPPWNPPSPNTAPLGLQRALLLCRHLGLLQELPRNPTDCDQMTTANCPGRENAQLPPGALLQGLCQVRRVGRANQAQRRLMWPTFKVKKRVGWGWEELFGHVPFKSFTSSLCRVCICVCGTAKCAAFYPLPVFCP